MADTVHNSHRNAMHSRIVVGIDGTEDGLRAVDYAAAEALNTGAHLLLVHVIAPPPGILTIPSEADEVLLPAGEIAVKSARERAETGGVPAGHVTVRVWAGQLTATLIWASRSANLMVLGRRGISGLDRLFAGSTSTSVGARAACPVVVVPHTYSPGNPTGRVVVGVDGSARSIPALAMAVAEASSRCGRARRRTRVGGPRPLLRRGPGDQRHPRQVAPHRRAGGRRDRGRLVRAPPGGLDPPRLREGPPGRGPHRLCRRRRSAGHRNARRRRDPRSCAGLGSPRCRRRQQLPGDARTPWPADTARGTQASHCTAGLAAGPGGTDLLARRSARAHQDRISGWGGQLLSKCLAANTAAWVRRSIPSLASRLET